MFRWLYVPAFREGMLRAASPLRWYTADLVQSTEPFRRGCQDAKEVAFRDSLRDLAVRLGFSGIAFRIKTVGCPLSLPRTPADGIRIRHVYDLSR